MVSLLLQATEHQVTYSGNLMLTFLAKSYETETFFLLPKRILKSGIQCEFLHDDT